jgi:hypothetical protein
MLYVNKNAELFDDNPNDMPLLGTPKLKSLNSIWPEPDMQFRKLNEESSHPTMNFERGDVLEVRERSIRSEFCTSESCWSGELDF